MKSMLAFLLSIAGFLICCASCGTVPPNAEETGDSHVIAIPSISAPEELRPNAADQLAEEPGLDKAGNLEDAFWTQIAVADEVYDLAELSVEELLTVLESAGVSSEKLSGPVPSRPHSRQPVKYRLYRIEDGHNVDCGMVLGRSGDPTKLEKVKIIAEKWDYTDVILCRGILDMTASPAMDSALLEEMFTYQDEEYKLIADCPEGQCCIIKIAGHNQDADVFLYIFE